MSIRRAILSVVAIVAHAALMAGLIVSNASDPRWLWVQAGATLAVFLVMFGRRRVAE